MKESSETSHSEGGGGRGGGYATIPYLYLYYNKHRKSPLLKDRATIFAMKTRSPKHLVMNSLSQASNE